MYEDNQKTISQPSFLEGVGLHTGKKIKLTLLPGKLNSGVIFKRTDIKENNLISANYNNVTPSILCTKIQNENNVAVSTIEHLMAAIYGEGIDNLLVEVDGPEVPIMDGSAKEFVKSIRESSFEIQKGNKKYIKVLKKIEIKYGDKFIFIQPSDKLKIDFQIVYNNPIIKKQREIFQYLGDNLESLYNSRTFCLFEDVEKIKKKGLAKGGSLENAIVVKGNEILNKDGLRYANEFVKHKILDCLGDLMLCGNRIRGSIVCSQGGHQLTYELIKKIFSNKENWALENQVLNKLHADKKIFSTRIAISA
tara:strand:+ start:42 stop:962 length:921 start_codon:yes stop_codon:yes gene_type:complete